MGDAGETDDDGVVRDVHDLDGDAPDVEPISAQVIEAVPSTQADVNVIGHKPYALQVAELVVELLLELVDDLRHGDVRQDWVVLRAEHDGIRLNAVESDNVASVGGRRSGSATTSTTASSTAREAGH